MRFRFLAICAILGAAAAPAARAQHDMHDMASKSDSNAMTGVLGIPMNRMGSGTTWIPDAVRLPSRDVMRGAWMLMVHGFAFGQYDDQAGPRGDTQFGSVNWMMLMADRAVGRGRLQLRFMPSLEPATVGRCGYPLLLQSGETCNGTAIVDRQHPHDFVTELSALYERPVSDEAAILLYAGPVGEPALSPVAFMHRPSSMDDPTAPLGHHWQDATHTSFGVVTVGVFTRQWRLEGSAFNGHDPDDNRWNIDKLSLNSFSGRLTINPNSHWSMTVGAGQIDHEHAGAPAKLVRLVASVMQGMAIGSDGQWASTLIFGRNSIRHGPFDVSVFNATHSVLFESEAVLDRHNTVFGRAELVQKSGEDLGVSGVNADEVYPVRAFSLGYVREIVRGRGMTLGIGGRGTINVVPSGLEATYGSRTPKGALIFARLRPN